MRIIVLGYIVRGPLGGLAWHNLHYTVGLARLGHDVYFLEDSEDHPLCYNPESHKTGADASYGLRFARDAFARLSLAERWASYDAPRIVRDPVRPERDARELARTYFSSDGVLGKLIEDAMAVRAG